MIKVDIQYTHSDGVICYYETSGMYFEFISYSSLIVAVGLALVLILLSICAFKNVRRLRSNPCEQHNQLRRMNKKDFQLVRCLYCHGIVYIVFNIFIAIYYVYLAATKHRQRTQIHQTIDDFLNGLGTFAHHIPYCASFFIFISLSRAFRQEIKRSIYNICGKNLTNIILIFVSFFLKK
mgnify:CR=1 FL=1